MIKGKIRFASAKESENDLTDYEKYVLQSILNLLQSFIIAAFTATDLSMLP